MTADADRKAEGSPPATPASEDTGTYLRSQRAGRDSLRAWPHMAKKRANGLVSLARKGLAESIPAHYQPCWREVAADPLVAPGQGQRDPAAGLDVMAA